MKIKYFFDQKKKRILMRKDNFASQILWQRNLSLFFLSLSNNVWIGLPILIQLSIFIENIFNIHNFTSQPYIQSILVIFYKKSLLFHVNWLWCSFLFSVFTFFLHLLKAGKKTCPWKQEVAAFYKMLVQSCIQLF